MNIGNVEEEIKYIVDEARKTIDTLSLEKICLDKSMIYEDEGIHFEVVPANDNAMRIYMCIRSAEDIAVGVLDGSHEHFNSEHHESDFSSLALEHFRKLLRSRQYITVKSKHGENYSTEVLFKVDGDVVSSFEDSEPLSGIFGAVSTEESEFTFL